MLRPSSALPYVSLFSENFPRFWKYLNKSKFLVEKSENLEIFRFWKFRDSSFLWHALLCLWPDFGVSRLLIWFSEIFSPLTSFRPKMDEHYLRLASITSDLLWSRTLFFSECAKLMFGEVLKTAQQNSRPFLGYLRKTAGGPIAPPPPSGRGLKQG